MLTKGIREFVAYILGRRELMVFNFHTDCQREQAFLLQHFNIHDSKKHNMPKRNREFLELMHHPFQPNKLKDMTFAEGVKQLGNG